MLTKFKLVEITENDIEDYNGKTYDLEVEEDHSYTANNIIVHNSVCTTRKKTGVGYPQLSAIIECADAAHGLNSYICGDGGITNSGDIAKAFGAGADFIMCGGLFAGHDECNGEIIISTESNNSKMKFYGMSSDDAMNKHYNGKANYRASEGKTVYVDYKGPVENTIKDILGGLRSTCTYTGAKSLKQLSKCTTFIRVSQQLNEVFGKS